MRFRTAEDGDVVPKGASLRRLYSTFAGGWPGTGLLLMRLVVGSAPVVRVSLTLLSDPPPLNVTIPAILLAAGGIMLIAVLWTPIAGVSVGITEIWKMLILHGDKPGWLLLATFGAALAMLGPGLWSSTLAFTAGSASSYSSQEYLFEVLRPSKNQNFLPQKNVLFAPKSLGFVSMWGCP